MKKSPSVEKIAIIHEQPKIYKEEIDSDIQQLQQLYQVYFWSNNDTEVVNVIFSLHQFYQDLRVVGPLW